MPPPRQTETQAPTAKQKCCRGRLIYSMRWENSGQCAAAVGIAGKHKHQLRIAPLPSGGIEVGAAVVEAHQRIVGQQLHNQLVHGGSEA